MKLSVINLLLFSVCFFSGCIGEDTGSCPEIAKNNLTLKFEHINNEGTDIFPEKIHRVDVFVFDTNGSFVKKQSVEKETLSVFPGTELNLDPGIYHIICLGNIYDKTSLSKFIKGSLLSDAFINFGILNNLKIAKGADPLYFAPKISSQAFTITVPEQGTQTVTIPFSSIHIKIKVFIKGFEDSSAEGKELLPMIELNNIPSGCDFNIKTSNDFISYENVTEYKNVDEQKMATLEFNTPLLGTETLAQLLIKKQSDQKTLTTISLKEFIRKHNISLTGTTEVVIPIFVEYKSASVSVTLPSWEQVPVTPGL